jgi:hypothetical protein
MRIFGFLFNCFPYTFPNMIFAWTFLLVLISDLSNAHGISPQAIFFIFIFSVVAVRFYGNSANSVGEKAFITAYNLAAIPFLIANTLATSYCLEHGTLSEGMDGYMVTFLYSPVIFGASFFVLYIIFKIMD